MRSKTNKCYGGCLHWVTCGFYRDMEGVLLLFEKELVFTEISVNDNPRREFLDLLASWCHFYTPKDK